MREIKFRGKDKETGEWIYGYYGYKDLTDEHFIIVPTFYAHSDYLPQYFNDHIVDPNTVGQWTGLKDKNGKDIYEGDLIRSYNELGDSFDVLTVVEYDVNAGVLTGLITDELHLEEVIGNIYENPDLLDQK